MHKRLTLLAIFSTCLGSWALGSPSAQLFVGVPGSLVFTETSSFAVGGVHLGVYDLYALPVGRIGVRGVVEAGTAGEALFVEGSTEALYSLGHGVVFYTGAGLGYTAARGVGMASTAIASALVGADFDAESAISLFVELSPHANLGGGGSVRVRSGFNVQLGRVVPEEVPNVQGDCCLIP